MAMYKHVAMYHIEWNLMYLQTQFIPNSEGLQLRAFLNKYQSSPISGNHSSKFNLFKCPYKQTAV